MIIQIEQTKGLKKISPFQDFTLHVCIELLAFTSFSLPWSSFSTNYVTNTTQDEFGVEETDNRRRSTWAGLHQSHCDHLFHQFTIALHSTLLQSVVQWKQNRKHVDCSEDSGYSSKWWAIKVSDTNYCESRCRNHQNNVFRFRVLRWWTKVKFINNYYSISASRCKIWVYDLNMLILIDETSNSMVYFKLCLGLGQSLISPLC